MRRFFVATAALSLLVGLWCAQSSPGQDKKVLESKDWGSLTGRVVYIGDDVPAAPESLIPSMQKHSDAKCCLGGKDIEKVKNDWMIDPKTKGVAFVMVYLKAPAGKYFPIHADDKVRKDTIEIDQPHCQFVPHMAGHYPSYFDGEKLVLTGQKFVVKNEATVPHNIRAIGNPLKNPGFNYTLPPGTEREAPLVPQNLPVKLQCDIHTWMNGWVGVFDHPYFAVTKADGSFSIPRVPAGAEVTIMAWQESVGYVMGKEGMTITLKAGKNELPDIKLSKSDK